MTSEGVSFNRLMRIRGYTRYEVTQSNDGRMDDTLVVGDPLCSIDESNMSTILTVTSFKSSSNKETKWIQADQLPEITVVGRQLKLEDEGDKYVWDGSSYSSSVKQYSGKSCTPIAPEINTDVGDQVFVFDKQLMLDIEKE